MNYTEQEAKDVIADLWIELATLEEEVIQLKVQRIKYVDDPIRLKRLDQVAAYYSDRLLDAFALRDELVTTSCYPYDALDTKISDLLNRVS